MRLAANTILAALFLVWFGILIAGFVAAHDWWVNGHVAIRAIWIQLVPIPFLLFYCGLPIRLRQTRSEDSATSTGLLLLILSLLLLPVWLFFVVYSNWTSP